MFDQNPTRGFSFSIGLNQLKRTTQQDSSVNLQRCHGGCSPRGRHWHSVTRSAWPPGSFCLSGAPFTSSPEFFWRIEENGQDSKIISFHPFPIKIINGFSIALHSTPSVYLRPSIVTISSGRNFLLSSIFSRRSFWRHKLSISQNCYSLESRSNPSKCSSCIKTQASTGIQRSNRSAHTPP